MSLQIGIPLFLIGGLLQATVLPHLRVFGGQPDLIVLVVLAWAIVDHDREGMAWAFVGGLFLDLFSSLPLGFSSVVLVPVAFVVGLTEAQVYRTNLALPLLLVAGGALIYHAGHIFMLRFVAGIPIVWSRSVWYVTVPSVLFDVILILPLLPILRRWHDTLHPRQVQI